MRPDCVKIENEPLLVFLSLAPLLSRHISVSNTIALHLRSSRIHLLDSQLAGLRLSVGLDPLIGR